MNTEMSANFDYDDGMRNETGQEEDEMMVEGIRIKEERMDEEDEEGFMENENKDELHIQVTGKMLVNFQSYNFPRVYSQVATKQLCNFPNFSQTPQAKIRAKRCGQDRRGQLPLGNLNIWEAASQEITFYV